MSVVKDVSSAAMPYVILGGLVLFLYTQRDRIAGWIGGMLNPIGTALTQDDAVGQQVDALNPNHFGEGLPGLDPAYHAGNSVAQWAYDQQQATGGQDLALTGAQTIVGWISGLFTGGSQSPPEATNPPGSNLAPYKPDVGAILALNGLQEAWSPSAQGIALQNSAWGITDYAYKSQGDLVDTGVDLTCVNCSTIPHVLDDTSEGAGNMIAYGNVLIGDNLAAREIAANAAKRVVVGWRPNETWAPGECVWGNGRLRCDPNDEYIRAIDADWHSVFGGE